MRSSILIFIFVLSLLSFTPVNANNISFTPQEQQFIKENSVIRVGGEMDWPPFDFVEDGKYVGVAKDYLDLLQKNTGLTFDVRTGYTWNELFEMFVFAWG